MSINKITANSVTYVGFEVLNKSLPFILIPILTHYITPNDMGLIAEFIALLGFLYVAVGLSVHGAINIAFFHLEKTDLAVYVFNAMLVMITSLIVCFFLTWFFSDFIHNLSSIPLKWLYVCELIAALQFINIMNLTLWQAEKKATAFGCYQLLQTSLNFFLTIYFVVWLTLGWEGRLYAQIISIIAVSIISVYLLIHRGYIKVKINILYIKDTLTFGVPLIPHALSGWLFMGFNIMLITKYLGTDLAGIFSISMQFSLIMNIIYQSANRAISPFLFERLKTISENGKIQLIKYTFIGFAIILLFTVTGFITSTIMISLFVGEHFQQAKEYLPYLFIYSMFNGFYLLVANYIFFAKKTFLLALVTCPTAAIHVIVSSSIVEHYGCTGVAISLMVSAIIMFTLVWWISNIVFPMPWNNIFNTTNK